MRHERLIKLLRHQCSLTMTEACAVISAYRSGTNYSSEAANHYGGNSVCLKDAIKARSRVYKTLGEGSPTMYWLTRRMLDGNMQ